MSEDRTHATPPPTAPAEGTGGAAPVSTQLRTVALCDLVDSTALVERLGDRRAADLFRRHDRVARDLLYRHHGREIDKTDGFLVLFERPIHAVAFALDYQRALRDLAVEEKVELAARVGVHVGDVLLWENAAEDVAKGAKPTEVEGLAKPLAARLMSLARPGQVLLSGMAHNLAQRAQDDLGPIAEKVRWPAHGRYRFKGLPAPLLVYEVGEVGIAPLKAPPSSSKAQRELPLWRQPRALALEALVAMAAVLALMFVLVGRPQPAIAFGERDWVVVGDLRNLTGTGDMGDALENAFRLSLEQSRFVNVLSDLTVHDALRRMTVPQDTRIDREVGSEIALREGARALILPTVADIGGRIRVSAEVIDPSTQTTVLAHSVDGLGIDSSLQSIDEVVAELRGRLGEAIKDIEDSSQPLADVVTPDLEALQIYTRARQTFYEGDSGRALELYDEALARDPGFALAHLGKAAIYLGGDDLPAARTELQAMAAHPERLAQREQLVLDAFQALFGPPVRAVERWQLLRTLYPDYFPAHYNLALFAWDLTNDYATGLRDAQAGVDRKNPALGPLHYLLATLLLGEERFDEARAHFEQASKLGGDFLGLVWIEYHIALRQYDEARALLGQRRQSGLASNDARFHITALSFAVDQGDWNGARSALAGAEQDAAAAAEPLATIIDSQALVLDYHALPPAAFAQRARATVGRRVSQLAQADPVLQPTLAHAALLAGYLAARSGLEPPARQVLAATAQVIARVQSPTLLDLQAMVEAELEREAGQAGAAVLRLSPRVTGREPLLLHLALAEAHRDAGDRAAALAALARLETHRGRALTERVGMETMRTANVAASNLATLARAELLAESGESDAAAQALSRFVSAWPATRPGQVARRVQALQGDLASALAGGQQQALSASE